MEKFTNFIKGLENNDNKQLLETIETAFKLIFEAPSSDDANAKQNGQPVGTYGAPSNATNFKANEDNEYFPPMSDKVLTAQSGGKKARLYSTAGKGVISHDPLKSGQGRSDNANSVDGGVGGIGSDISGD